MARRGLLQATSDEKDARSRRLRLTQAGRALLRRALPARDA